jgi:sterol desaturase/sphingolipid hydroxylase (fatty acid hydroxylase superfamily)
MIDEQFSNIFLFLSFFVFYGLENFFPLAIGSRKHFWTNIGFAFVLFGLNAASSVLTIHSAEWTSKGEVGVFNIIDIPIWCELLISIIVLDLWAGYLPHFIFHKSVLLWHFHSIHHSDNHVDVTTTFRKHPIEGIINIIFNITGLVILGLPLWMLLVYVTISTIHAQLEHANIFLPSKVDKILQAVFVTPNMHKIHHSLDASESNSNYSNIFSIWDRIFGTYRKKDSYANIAYGLDYVPEKSSKSFWQLITWPIQSFKIFSKGKNT